MSTKTRRVLDIKSGKSYSETVSPILNLSYRKQPVIPLRKAVKLFVSVIPVFYLALGPAVSPSALVLAPTAAQILAAGTPQEERLELENQLNELEKQINEYEATIVRYRRQGRNLQSEINVLTAKISKLSLQIKSVNLSLEKLDRQIGETESKIVSTESDIEFNKAALSAAVQDLYENENRGLLEIVLANRQLSDFFGNLNNLMILQDNLRITVRKISDLRQNLLDDKEQLALERSDAEALRIYQDSQRRALQNNESQKKEFLNLTKSEESKFQELLTTTKKTAAEIRSRIFELLGGGELTFEKAYEFARLAEQATGVRAALTLAVLDRESVFGKNVGQCTYQTAMHPRRDIPAFLEIVASLGISADSIKVSCANSDGAYGGAMGPAQFIPSTWQIYKDRIARITGNNPPSPWRNADAFVAAALYLQDAYDSSSCLEYSRQIPNQAQTLRERCAAAKYYAGSRWYYYRWAYGEPVIEKANAFQRDIDILNS